MSAKTEFDTYYSFLLKRVMQAKPEHNRRTGKMVRAVDGAFFRLGSIPILTLRNINPMWTAAEVVWFMGGRSDVKFMQDLGFKNWNEFVNKDGIVESATGYRWRHRFGRLDQLMAVIDKLDADPSSRQAVLLSWNPNDDLLKPGPNAPCVMLWHMHIIDGLLHMSVIQRSADLYFGLPHDILGARIVQELIAAGLDVTPGNLSYQVSNAHLYEDQWSAAEEMITREELCGEKAQYPLNLGLTKDITVQALGGDQWAASAIFNKIMAFYKPFPPIRGPKLVK